MAEIMSVGKKTSEEARLRGMARRILLQNRALKPPSDEAVKRFEDSFYQLHKLFERADQWKPR